MEKVYEYEKGTIFVTLPETCDREKLILITEDFLRKVISGRIKDGNGNTRGDFAKE